MVMITRSAHRKACESSNSSDVSQNNNIPPWCSAASGKVCEKRKPRKVPPWEIRSSYPIRENIWEYLYENEQSYAEKRKRAKCNCRQKAKRTKGKTSGLFFALLFLTIGVMTSIWLNHVPKISLLANILPKEKLTSLLNMATSSAVTEECCHKLRYLAAELSRMEQALRHSERIRKSVIATSQITQTDHLEPNNKYIEGVKVSRGSDTTDYGGRVALWGIVPLWRAAPPPDTILTLRKPTPSDCWPFAGSLGELLIELPVNSQVRSISIEHIRPDAAQSAPKQFILYSILQNGTWITSLEGEYKHKGPAKQFYELNCNPSLKKMVFRVLSNQGNPRYTCIYRLHIYG